MAVEKAIFGAGCFWGVEEAFRNTKGVINTTVGFSGGRTKNPSYAAVCTHLTGHAEVCLVEYDNKIISYKELLDVFWSIHNPTTKNRQGWDIGSQYRSIIFYFNEKQKRTAEKSKEELDKSGKFSKPIVTKIEKAQPFYKAEEYHQRYLQKRNQKSCAI